MKNKKMEEAILDTLVYLSGFHCVDPKIIKQLKESISDKPRKE